MTETVEYSVLGSMGEVEIRLYPKLILATVKGTSDDFAFSILFRYIAGGNRPRSEMALTVPLLSEGRNQQIAMTSPVISDEETFSFVMPDEYTMETLPEPVDDRILVREVPERTLAVTMLDGRPKDVQAHCEDLIAALDDNGLVPKGRPFLMRYNSPSTPGFLRRNEIGVEIDSITKELPGS